MLTDNCDPDSFGFKERFGVSLKSALIVISTRSGKEVDHEQDI
ncbi:hypothetical protein [Labrenzia sp. THAF82]|nr:hypothetical protein [Labrenzia sp. THAF82]